MRLKVALKNMTNSDDVVEYLAKLSGATVITRADNYGNLKKFMQFTNKTDMIQFHYELEETAGALATTVQIKESNMMGMATELSDRFLMCSANPTYDFGDDVNIDFCMEVVDCHEAYETDFEFFVMSRKKFYHAMDLHSSRKYYSAMKASRV